MKANKVNQSDFNAGDGLNIVGYADQWSVRAGEQLKFMISTTSSSYTANVVRLLGGMTDPDAPDLPYEIVPAQCNGNYPGRRQHIYPGSYAELPLPETWMERGEFTVQLWTWPTTPTLGRIQTLWSSRAANGAGVDLALDGEGHLVFSLADKTGQSAQIRSDKPLEAKIWYGVVAQYSTTGSLAALFIHRVDGWSPIAGTQEYASAISLDFRDTAVARVLLAADAVGSQGGERKEVCRHFNGKLENPRFFSAALDRTQWTALLQGTDPHAVAGADVVADYDFGAEISSTRVVDRSAGARHGLLYQAPTRAVTGHDWTGEHVDFRTAPDHYAAVHFHDDDLEDAEWEPDITWKLPDDLRSGMYALRLEADGKTDYVPFFVRPALCAKTSDVLFLVPTNTYLAYANERLFEIGLDSFMAHELKLAEQDRYIVEHPEVGKSAYDTHNDGSGVCCSSRLRPVLNIRPHYRNWLTGTVRHLAADLFITGWLEKRDGHYDVATDEDLNREGVELLQSYRVLVTGSHPEYWSRPMLMALKQYLAEGGRLMYLGANGFYWVTSLDPERPHLAEIRRGNSGTRCWDSPPGELYHSTTGEPGGLWRHHGFVPQRLVGVGFTSQGWGPGCGYRRLPDSFNPAVKFIFEGIGEEETIGDFGYVLGGAAGDEVDRLDFDLGTPRHTMWLATSTGLDDRYQFVHEDQLMTSPGQGGTENPLVRADMTYFDIDGGGAVFSVGSINWAGSMAWNQYENNTVRVCDNVLNHFLEA